MNATVVSLPTRNERIRERKRAYAHRATKAARRQGMAATAVGLVALTLTALSLSHLSHGIEIVTHAPVWEAWAMAVGIDMGFVVLELAQISVTNERTIRKIQGYIRPSIIGTLIGSAGMNAFAFGIAAPDYWMMAPAIAFGVAIPAMIYALTRVGATMWLTR